MQIIYPLLALATLVVAAPQAAEPTPVNAKPPCKNMEWETARGEGGWAVSSQIFRVFSYFQEFLTYCS